MPSSLGLAVQPQAVESAQHQHEALGGPAVHWDQRVIDQVSMKQRLHSKIHTSHPRSKDRLKTCHYKRQQHHRSCRWRVKWGRHRRGKKGNQPLVSLGGHRLCRPARLSLSYYPIFTPIFLCFPARNDLYCSVHLLEFRLCLFRQSFPDHSSQMSRCLPSAFSMHLSRLLQPAFAQQLLLPTDDVWDDWRVGWLDLKLR